MSEKITAADANATAKQAPQTSAAFAPPIDNRPIISIDRINGAITSGERRIARAGSIEIHIDDTASDQAEAIPAKGPESDI
jgi:hypothetical protein